MGEWDSRLMKVLVENEVQVDIAARYVDDIRLVLKGLKAGWRWEGKRLKYRRKWEREDKREGLSTTASRHEKTREHASGAREIFFKLRKLFPALPL